MHHLYTVLNEDFQWTGMILADLELACQKRSCGMKPDRDAIKLQYQRQSQLLASNWDVWMDQSIEWNSCEILKKGQKNYSSWDIRFVTTVCNFYCTRISNLYLITEIQKCTRNGTDQELALVCYIHAADVLANGKSKHWFWSRQCKMQLHHIVTHLFLLC